MSTQKAEGRMIIAGPGAGKTHNMVATILQALPPTFTLQVYGCNHLYKCCYK